MAPTTQNQQKERVRKSTPIAKQFALCKKYTEGSYRSAQDFMDRHHDETGGVAKSTFNGWVKKFKAGKLDPQQAGMKNRRPYFPMTEKKMLDFMNARAQLCVKDNLGLSWNYIQHKATQINEKIPSESGFKASNGWTQRFLNRNNFKSVQVQGEAGDMDEQQVNVLRAKFQKELLDTCQKHNIQLQHLYNADQTGLFYRKLPNRMFLKKEAAKTARGCKQMKSKERLTLMVCTAANGDKIPLSLVGKTAEPRCFRLLEGKRPPLPYTNQKSAWFDTNVTVWWILNVFWPAHKKKHGNVRCVLILDNCPAHKSLEHPEYCKARGIPAEIIFLFFPPNLTCHLQPADMGIIAVLKVGYKIILLTTLLPLFEEENAYEKLKALREKTGAGLRGLGVGGQPHVLDAIQILHGIWSVDGKYARESGIRNCWLKGDILTGPLLEGMKEKISDGGDENPVIRYDVSDSTRMRNDVGDDESDSDSMEVDTVIIEPTVTVEPVDDTLDQCYDNMVEITKELRKAVIDEKCAEDDLFAGTIFSDKDCDEETLNNLKDGMKEWCFVEDNEDIVNSIVDDEIDKIMESGFDECTTESASNHGETDLIDVDEAVEVSENNENGGSSDTYHKYKTEELVEVFKNVGHFMKKKKLSRELQLMFHRCELNMHRELQQKKTVTRSLQS